MANARRYAVPRYRLSLVKDGSREYAERSVDFAEQAASVVGAMLSDVPVENIVVVHLDSKNKLLGVEIVARGGLYGCAVTPAEVFRGALVACARAIIIAHNHPSGDPTASVEDLRMTRHTVEAGKVLGIPVLDHVIVTPHGGQWSSMAANHSDVF